MTEARRRLGETLVEAGVITKEALERALVLQQQQQLRLGTILLHEGFVSESQLVQALSLKLSIPWVSLWRVDIPDDVLELVPANVAEEFFLIPIHIRTSQTGERVLFVAMNDPTDEDALRFVAATAGMPVKPMVAGPSDIAAAIRAYYYGEEEDSVPAPGFEAPVVPLPQPASPPPPPRNAHSAKEPPPAPPRTPGAPPPPPGNAEDAVEELDDDAVEEADEKPAEEPSAPEAPADTGPADAAHADAAPAPVDAAPAPAPAPAPANSANDAPQAPEEGTTQPKVFSDKASAQREAEKRMFGVGGSKPTRGFALTLLDGTTISFGAPKKRTAKAGTPAFTKEDLIAGLKAAASGDPVDDFLPSEKWEAYLAALLEVLFNKHLVLFPELMKELDSIVAKK
jgi:type IV pilus assembly protein PilB